jgi:hypothetical protein
VVWQGSAGDCPYADQTRSSSVSGAAAQQTAICLPLLMKL